VGRGFELKPEGRADVGVPTWQKTVKAPAPVQVADANAVPLVDDDHVNEGEPQPKDAPGGAASIPGSSRDPTSANQGGTLDDGTSVPRSFDIVDLGASELGLSGYPRVPPLPASYRKVAGGAELAYLSFATMG
jgi:hypothetical protein